MPDVRLVVTARALIVQDHKLLLVSHNGNVWYTPGGWLEGFETLKECCARETYEELGIQIDVQKLLYVSEYKIPAEKSEFNENVNKIEHYFVCEVIGQQPQIINGQNQWIDSDNGNIKFAKWFEIASIKTENIVPEFLKTSNITLDTHNTSTTYIPPILG
jgi:8-oxo-dGTP diphosphatase